MKNIEEKILMADEEIKQLQNKRKKLISQLMVCGVLPVKRTVKNNK